MSAVSSLAGIAEFIINITKGKESTAEDICEYVNWINADDVRQYVLELSCPNIMWVVHGRGIEADGSVSELWGPPAVQAVNGTILDNVRRHTRRFTTNQSDREVYEKALVSSMFKACCATANRGWMEECDDADIKKTICRPWRENAVACDESFTCKAARDACVKVCTIITGEDGAQQPDETVDACHRSCE